MSEKSSLPAKISNNNSKLKNLKLSKKPRKKQKKKKRLLTFLLSLHCQMTYMITSKS